MNCNMGNIIKGMLIGGAIATVATILLTNKKMSKKIKDGAEMATENITSLFKMN